MTEKILDLSIQAGLACDGTDFDEQAVLLFAEMIIRGCITALIDSGIQCSYTTTDQAIATCVVEGAIKNINTTFGRTS